jgi:hypothetical protein
MTRLYAVSTKNVISGTDFRDSLVADEPRGPTPADRRRPMGEWTCDASDCAVGDVRIDAFYRGEAVPDAPPSMHCPTCGSTLRFVTYLEEVRLVPASPSPDKLLATASA